MGWYLLSLCFYFRFLWTKPHFLLHIENGRWGIFLACPLLDVMLENRPEAAPQVSCGITMQGSDPNRSTSVGLIICLRGVREEGREKQCWCLHQPASAIKTQLSEVSGVSGQPPSIIIKMPIQTGHRQFRQNRI